MNTLATIVGVLAVCVLIIEVYDIWHDNRKK